MAKDKAPIYLLPPDDTTPLIDDALVVALAAILLATCVRPAAVLEWPERDDDRKAA